MKYDWMREVHTTGFVLDELVLYLDTHPTDCEAFQAYRNARNAYEKAVANYCAHKGPLFYKDDCGKETYSWNDGPWPWEGGCC